MKQSLSLGLLLALAMGCAVQKPPAAIVFDPANPSFQSQPHHVRFSYPSTWHPVHDDTVLTLVPSAESSIGQHVLVVEQPDLPFHIPGLIPLPSVESGFVDDQKKRYKQVAVAQSTDHPLAGSNGREVVARGLRDGKPVVVMALLCVHGDAVYLVVATTDSAGEKSARDAFDEIVKSFQWID
jgi:hypothetical protein